ncbi:hypothetical protein CBL_14382 [Carabus blaptoides fortunei]
MPLRKNTYLLAPNGRLSNESNVSDFSIRTLQVEELVSEIRENLRLSATTMKCRSNISHKSSRASPYKIPSRCEKDKSCMSTFCKNKCQKPGSQRHIEDLDDPYDFLQKLLRDGGLVQEAVRRLQLDLTPKQRYFYDSEEDLCNAVARFQETGCAQESATCN